MRQKTAIAIVNKPTNHLHRKIIVLVGFLLVWFTIAVVPSVLLGQDGGPALPDGVGGEQVPTEVPVTGGGNNQNNQPTQEADRTTSEFNAQDLIDRLQIPTQDVEIENRRIQPFVGRSIERYGEQELVHPRSQIAPGSSGGGGGGGGLNFNLGPQGRGATGAGDSLSFQVQRQSIRTRIIPSFRVPVIDNAQVVSTNFRSRIARLPATRSIGGVNIQMDGRTAILSGTVGSAAERSRIERMARLEPGVYRIQNQIQVTAQ